MSEGDSPSSQPRIDAAEQIKANNWRQGSILPGRLVQVLDKTGALNMDAENASQASLFSQIVPPILSKCFSISNSASASSGVWVVITHDCDVTNHSLDLEPFVEIVFGELISQQEKDGNKEWGKNSRVLQIASPVGLYEETSFLEFNANTRVAVPRRFLAEFQPADSRLPAETVERFRSWFAKRYVRRGFADTFNERTRKAVSKLRKKFKKTGHLVSGVYLLVADDELEGDYEVIVWVAMRTADYDNSSKRKDANVLMGTIEAELDGCDGVTVLDSELRSEAEISLDDLRLMKRWDFDDLTLRDEPQDTIPPQV